ncbi:MAG: HAD family phosphatase [Chloroflexi bacterium]|nr:MAG: HAD family phosphatase [Chloroflexota bacterium]
MLRLLLFDIDGVLTDGEAQPLDLELLGLLREFNRAARADASRPAVTLCTGRPAPYVEIMLQAIDGHVPGIYENGAGVYVPLEYRFLPHPAVGSGETFTEVRQRLHRALVRTGRAFFQPGKEHTLSIFANNPAEPPRLYDWTVDALGPLVDQVELEYAASCLNVMPRGVNKGRGLEFLCQLTGYAPADILGVGDSAVDLSFLALTGCTAAPANASDAVKQAVQYVSPLPTSQGVRDILRQFMR